MPISAPACRKALPRRSCLAVKRQHLRIQGRIETTPFFYGIDRSTVMLHRSLPAHPVSPGLDPFSRHCSRQHTDKPTNSGHRRPGCFQAPCCYIRSVERTLPWLIPTTRVPNTAIRCIRAARPGLLASRHRNRRGTHHRLIVTNFVISPLFVDNQSIAATFPPQLLDSHDELLGDRPAHQRRRPPRPRCLAAGRGIRFRNFFQATTVLFQPDRHVLYPPLHGIAERRHRGSARTT